MRKVIIAALFVFLSCFSNAQTKKYKGIITAMFNDYVGYVYLNLSGENNGMIRIDGKSLDDSTMLSKLLNIPDKEYATFKVNAKLVSKVIIDKDTFYRYNLVDKGSKYEDKDHKQNCYVKHVYGKNDIQLFEGKDQNNNIQYYVKLPKDEQVIDNINHPWLATWNTSVVFAFRRCESIEEKFLKDYEDKVHKEKYPFYNLTTTEARLATWKKLIDEYDSCKLKDKK